jgi:peptidoglycan/LPS O-acetylase OafA/YrhL
MSIELAQAAAPRLLGSRLVHLDMLRGLAALAVVIDHMRGFLLVHYGALQAPGFADKALYLLTGLGHQAVIAFFALSGYLVGGKALKNMLSGSWSGPQYMVARLARLWTVVIPALEMTLALDIVGRALGGGAGYDGVYWNLLSSGPHSGEPADNSLATFFANAFFLQTIVAPAYGTNGPLWSLANEFWYYVIFSLAASAIISRRSVYRRLVAAAGAAVLALALPSEMLLLGTIWVAGAITNHMTMFPRLRRLFANPIYLTATACAVGGSILRQRSSLAATAHDIVLGGAWALLLPALAALPHWGGLYARLALGLSEISYTLYATHFPFLALVWFTALAPKQFAPGPASLVLATGLLALTLLYAGAIWWCFERNTARIRAAAIRALGG